jgi:uncharacterized membrane protein
MIPTEIMFHVLMIISLVLLICLILYWLGNQMWAMQLLKNKCIAECIEINKLNPNTCVC